MSCQVRSTAPETPEAAAVRPVGGGNSVLRVLMLLQAVVIVVMPVAA